MIDRAEPNRQLDEILGRVKYIGSEPPPSEEEVTDRVVDEIRAVRAEHAKGLLPIGEYAGFRILSPRAFLDILG